MEERIGEEGEVRRGEMRSGASPAWVCGARQPSRLAYVTTIKDLEFGRRIWQGVQVAHSSRRVRGRARRSRRPAKRLWTAVAAAESAHCLGAGSSYCRCASKHLHNSTWRMLYRVSLSTGSATSVSVANHHPGPAPSASRTPSRLIHVLASPGFFADAWYEKHRREAWTLATSVAAIVDVTILWVLRLPYTKRSNNQDLRIL